MVFENIQHSGNGQQRATNSLKNEQVTKSGFPNCLLVKKVNIGKNMRQFTLDGFQNSAKISAEKAKPVQVSQNIVFRHSTTSAIKPDNGRSEEGVFCPDHWIYPTNYPLRDYQYSITRTCLFNNTLVCLPTGLGKTFIAAVVIYNFSLWFPTRKIVFMAPTKPLVTQQVAACREITGLDGCELTGNVSAVARQAKYTTESIFFMTPQTLENDLKSKLFPIDSVQCLILFSDMFIDFRRSSSSIWELCLLQYYS
jgi:hypothetical protein